MTDPYPALGSNYRPPIETYTTNRSLTLTQEQVRELRDILGKVIEPSSSIIKLYDTVKQLE